MFGCDEINKLDVDDVVAGLLKSLLRISIN
jgi:hypothetical protein